MSVEREWRSAVSETNAAIELVRLHFTRLVDVQDEIYYESDERNQTLTNTARQFMLEIRATGAWLAEALDKNARIPVPADQSMADAPVNAVRRIGGVPHVRCERCGVDLPLTICPNPDYYQSVEHSAPDGSYGPHRAVAHAADVEAAR